MRRISVSVSVVALWLLLIPLLAGARDGDEPGYVLKKTAGVLRVHHGPRRYTPTLARVHPDAILKVRKTDHKTGCGAGWFVREGGGYVCGKYLKRTDETEPRPAPRDLPDVLKDVAMWEVLKGGSLFFKKPKHIKDHHIFIRLVRGSYLAVRESLHKYGDDFHRNREGWWATSANTKELPPAVLSLGVDVTDQKKLPVGVVIDADTPLKKSPTAEKLETLDRWETLWGDDGEAAQLEDGWVKINGRGYVEDEHLARFRPAKRPLNVEDDEKWLAVDLEEQLLQAWVGSQLVRIMPCSTGIKDNTRPGRYRIKWKRRLQTLNLKGGHLRVEDVQYVMYYDRRRSIAIHTAYWHDDFGRRKSHGCVNLPRDDARWVYDWALPFSRPEESETFHTRVTPGTKVIVFE